MPEFKIKCTYLGVREKKFFKDKEPTDYHKFSIGNEQELPRQFFHPSTRLGKGKKRNGLEGIDYCWLFISTNLVKKNKLNFKRDQEYQFLMKLGEPKTADFTIYYYIPPEPYEYEKHSMVLKSKEYWENTVQKIGFWGSEDYFYDPKKETKKPIPKSNSNSDQSENKNKWGKIFLFCLPIIILALLSFLIIRWVSKKRKKNNSPN